MQSKEEIINYNDLDFKLENTIRDISEKIQIEKKPLNRKLLNFNSCLCMYQYNNKKYSFIFEGIIFPSKIMNIIKNVYNEFEFVQKKNIIFKENFIYYINKEKIIVGIFNKNALFKPKFVFIYNSCDLLEEEKNKMILSNINDYLKQKNCDNHSKIQKLVDEKGELLGLLFILNQTQKNSNSKPYQLKNKNY